MKKIITLIIAVHSLLLTAHLSEAQDTIYVPQNYLTIQQGIDAAVDGNVVLVDTGTYEENINFKGKAIIVASKFIYNHDEFYRDSTIIDGSKPSNPDSASVVYFINDEDTLSVLHGFTIQGGKGTKDMAFRAGGGILGFEAGPKIEYNRIINNECTDDGGWATGGGINIWASYNSIPVIRGNEISNNACYKINNGTGVPYGGGISVEYAGNGYECLIENNIISNNICSNEVQDQWAIGGGIYVDHLKATIVNNQIIGNQIISADDYWVIYGAGIATYGIQDSSIISGNLIDSNFTTAPYSMGGGIGVMRNSGKVYIDRNIFSNNQARRGGGVALNDLYNEVVFTNNVLKGNYATYRGGGLYIWDNGGKSQGYTRAAGKINKIGISGEKNNDSGISVIANNTFIENSDYYEFATSIHFRIESPPLIAFNNIFYDLEGGTGSEVFISETTATAYLFNNLLDTVNNIICYGNWQGADNIVGDPDIKDDSCHIAGTSICINAGLLALEVNDTTYYCPDHDIDGQSRPHNGGVDIGTDEKIWVGIADRSDESNLNTQVYPNPASNTISLVSQPGIEVTSLEIIDIQGKVVMHQKVTNNNLSFNVSCFTKGLYFIRIHTSKGIEVKKLVVQ